MNFSKTDLPSGCTKPSFQCIRDNFIFVLIDHTRLWYISDSFCRVWNHTTF